MNRKTTIFTVFIVASLLLVGVTWTVYGIRREFQHELFDGEEAISFIATDHLLSRQWLECGLGEDESRIVRVVAAQGHGFVLPFAQTRRAPVKSPPDIP